MTGIESGEVELLGKSKTSFNRKSLEIIATKNDGVIIHEHGGYRLHLSGSEFIEIKNHLDALLKDRRWVWLIERYRDLKGDI